MEDTVTLAEVLGKMREELAKAENQEKEEREREIARIFEGYRREAEKRMKEIERKFADCDSKKKEKLGSIEKFEELLEFVRGGGRYVLKENKEEFHNINYFCLYDFERMAVDLGIDFVIRTGRTRETGYIILEPGRRFSFYDEEKRPVINGLIEILASSGYGIFWMGSKVDGGRHKDMLLSFGDNPTIQELKEWCERVASSKKGAS